MLEPFRPCQTEKYSSENDPDEVVCSPPQQIRREPGCFY